MSNDERVLRYVAGIIAIVSVSVIALTEILVNKSISPGVMAILGGPVLLVITLIATRSGNGK